jgi:hypothetical protein
VNLAFDAITFLARNVGAAVSDGRVWLAMIVASVVGSIMLVVGVWIARGVGVLDRDAPDGETLGVGLGVGAILIASAWAAIASGGRSAFTPVAASLAVTIALCARRASRVRPRANGVGERRLPRLPVGNRTLVASALFVAGIGLLYGATIAPSPRDGVQPVEWNDEAFYSILGRDLSTSGTETIYSPSGFDDLPGLPRQAWYHWGELWLAAATITTFGLDPTIARHYVVLPLLLLAAVALTGSLVRRAAREHSRMAFIFGCLACLLLAPLPIPTNHFTWWASGMVVGISLYGLAGVTVLLLLVIVSAQDNLSRSVAGILFTGTVAASLLASHVVLAILAMVGVGSVVAAQVVVAALERRRPVDPVRGWWTIALVTIVVTGVIAIWGWGTGHAIGTSGFSPSVEPFNDVWRLTISVTLLGSLVLFAIPVALLMAGRGEPWTAALMLGAIAVIVFGAIAWGATLPDYTNFYLYFGGLAAFAAPVAAVAVAIVWRRLRSTGRNRLAAVLLVATLAQLEMGVLGAGIRLYQISPHDNVPIPVTILRAIERIEPDGKIAYACRAHEEVAFWGPTLLSIDAHTGKRIVPLCHQAEVWSQLTGGHGSADVTSPLFLHAPQRAIFPTADARPSPNVVAVFMRSAGIEYLYVDALHPNVLVPGAILVAESGSTKLLRLP